MFGNTIAGELRRRLLNLRENFLNNQQSPAQSISSPPTYPAYPSPSSFNQSQSSEERKNTSAAIQEYIKKTSNKEPTVKDDVLSGKIKSTSRRDLLELENISLETFIHLLEAENEQLSVLLEHVDNNSNNDDDNEDILIPIRDKVHPNMKQVHEQFLLHRRQAAVDLVESIFRCLQSRPPPRVRGDSVRTRTGTTISDISMSMSASPFSSQLRRTISDRTTEMSMTSQTTIDMSPSRTVDTSMISYDPYSSVQNSASNSARTSMIDDSSLPIVVNRRGSLSYVPSPVYVYSVFKVNKFRKNSPHVLEVDGRTCSLSIKDANGNTKVELTENNLIATRVDSKHPKIVTITYRIKLKESVEKQVVILHKKYKFSSIKYCEEFRDVIASHVLNRDNKEQSISAIAQFKKILQEETPSTLDPLKPRVAPNSIEQKEEVETPYVPMPTDVSRISLRDDILDAVDGVAENLARLWVVNNSKENYKVNQNYGVVSSRARLKNQLRTFMGANTYNGNWHSLATLMAGDLVKMIVHCGYTIELKPEKQSVQQIMNPKIQKLIGKLAVESNERWCFLSIRSNMKKRRHSTEAKLQMALENMDIPPPPIVEENLFESTETTEEMPPPPPPNDKDETPPPPNDKDETPPPPNDKDETPPPPPSDKEEERIEEENNNQPQILRAPTTISLDQNSDYPIVAIRQWKDVTKEQQALHIADATEVIRTLFEYSYVVKETS